MGAFEAIRRAWMRASPPTFYALAQGFPLSLAQIHILERLFIWKDKTNVLRIYSRFLFIFWSLDFSWRKFHLLETLTCKVKMGSFWGKTLQNPFWENSCFGRFHFYSFQKSKRNHHKITNEKKSEVKGNEILWWEVGDGLNRFRRFFKSYFYRHSA